ncbi:MAG: hypothetical protein WC475_00040 [Candidatus Paceibacterota bacterium]
MDKKLLIILITVVLLIGLGVGGYFYWKKSKTATEAGIPVTAEEITDSATQGVLPSLGTNPLENKPDINPADKANPFTNVETNPF